jgi:multiple sugar transport system ATP-binding protein
VQKAARILNLTPYLQRTPKELSGGQRQRVAIGRAIVRQPKVFLFDEPLSNLDAALRGQTRVEIAKLHRELGATTIYVTHDQVEAMTLADRIVVLEAGEVRQIGRPLELYHQPRNQFVAGFIGSPRMNFLPVRVTAVDAAGVSVSAPELGALPHVIPVDADGVQVGQPMTLGIRPEHIGVGSGGGAGVGSGVGSSDASTLSLSGEIGLVERLGHETYVELAGATGLTVSALVGGNTRVALGERIALTFSPADAHLFAADGRACQRLRVPDVVGWPVAA